MSFASPTSTMRRVLRTTLAGVVVLGLSLTLESPGVARPAGTTAATAAQPATGVDAPTDFRLSTFNVLGYNHTSKGGNKHGWASGTTRMKWAVQLLDRYHLDVVGFQEMQYEQAAVFDKLTRGKWARYIPPKANKKRRYPDPNVNSIAWRSSEWTYVEGRSMKVPYFHGNMIKMPYVLLRNNHTHRLAWFYNSHNPANTRGNASKWRKKDVQLEIQLVRRLRKERPDVPVFITGDKNARSEYFCPMARSGMHAADGGSATGSSCHPPAHASIDWILGTPGVSFHNYRSVRDSLVKKTTDHHLIYTDALIPSAESKESSIDHVVMIAVDGLRPSAIRETGKGGTPRIHRMIDDGVSTMNARTLYHSVGELANAVSMLTGLRADPKQHGHGLGWPHRRIPATIAKSAGRYVSSVFGVTHDFGGRTILVSSDRDLIVLRRSWDRHHGAVDPYVPNNGRSKWTKFTPTRNDARTASRAAGWIRSQRPTFLFAGLNSVAVQGRKHGWHSKKYHSAVATADRQIGQILNAINATSGMAGHTAVILTAERGGTNRRGNPARQFVNYRVPVVVTGPGIPRGSNLYALNPQLADPHDRRPSYGGRQPVRTAYLANLATGLLGETPIPGSDMDPGSKLNVLPLG